MTIDKLESLPIREVSLTDTRHKAEMKCFLNNISAAMLKVIARPLVDSLSKFQYKSVAKPNAAEPKAINNIRNGAKQKADFVDFLLVFFCPSNWSYFWHTMSKSMQNLFVALARKHYLTEEEADALYGSEVFLHRGYWRTDLVDELEPFIGSSTEQILSENGMVQAKGILYFRVLALYDMMLTWLSNQQEEQTPDLEGLLTFSAEGAIFHDLSFIASLYDCGQLKVGSTKLRTKSFEKAVEKVEMEDFKIDTQIEWDTYCSRRYFVPMLYAIYAEEMGLEGLVDQRELIREIVAADEEYDEYFFKLFAPHIKGVKSNLIDYYSVDCFIDSLYQIFSANKITDWTSVEQIRVMCRTYENIKNGFAEKDYLLFDKYEMTRQWLLNNYTDGAINVTNQISQLSDVILNSLLFALASWGVLEIAYLPEMPKKAVSPFDALKYVRLTKLGRYAYGLDDDYTPPISEDESNALELIDDRLLIKVNNTNSPRVFVLERFAQPVAPTLYKVETKCFMKDCENRADVENKINLFKRNFGEDLPQVWNDFFEDALNRCDAFSKAGKAYTIRRINKNDKRLQEIILTDTRLKSYILRAEGYLILIEQKHVPDFIKIMREYGYMM